MSTPAAHSGSRNYSSIRAYNVNFFLSYLLSTFLTYISISYWLYILYMAKMASGVKLSEIEELCRLIEEYRYSEENLKSENEILIQENIHLTERQEKMADFIEVLEKTVVDLDEELTRNELLVEERENDIDVLKNEIKLYQKEESNLAFKDKLQRDNYEGDVANLQARLIKSESNHKEKDEIISEYELSMNRQDEYIHSLIAHLDRSNESYDSLMEEIVRIQDQNESKDSNNRNEQPKSRSNSNSNSHQTFQALFKIIDMQKYERAKERVNSQKNQETSEQKSNHNDDDRTDTNTATIRATTINRNNINVSNFTTTAMVNLDMDPDDKVQGHHTYSYTPNKKTSMLGKDNTYIAEEKRSSSSCSGFKPYQSSRGLRGSNAITSYRDESGRGSSFGNENGNNNHIVYSDIDIVADSKPDSTGQRRRLPQCERERERDHYHRDDCRGNDNSNNKGSNDGIKDNYRKDRPTGPSDKPPSNMTAPIARVRSLMSNRDGARDGETHIAGRVDRDKGRDDDQSRIMNELGGRYGAYSRDNDTTPQRSRNSNSYSNSSSRFNRYHHSPSPIDETMLRTQEREKEKEMAWVRQIRVAHQHGSTDSSIYDNDYHKFDHRNGNAGRNVTINQDKDISSRSRLRPDHVRLDTISPASMNSVSDASKDGEYEMRSLARDRMGDAYSYRNSSIDVNSIVAIDKGRERDKENISSATTVTSESSLSIEIPRSKINNVAKANITTNTHQTTYRRNKSNASSPTSPLSEASRSPGMPAFHNTGELTSDHNSSATKVTRECRSPIANVDGLDRKAYREKRRGVLQSITSAASSFRRFSSKSIMGSKFGSTKINTIHPAEDSDVSVESRGSYTNSHSNFQQKTEGCQDYYDNNHKHSRTSPGMKNIRHTSTATGIGEEVKSYM